MCVSLYVSISMYLCVHTPTNLKMGRHPESCVRGNGSAHQAPTPRLARTISRELSALPAAEANKLERRRSHRVQALQCGYGNAKLPGMVVMTRQQQLQY